MYQLFTCINYDCTKFSDDPSTLAEEMAGESGKEAQIRILWWKLKFITPIYPLKMRLSVINNQSWRPPTFFYFFIAATPKERSKKLILAVFGTFDPLEKLIKIIRKVGWWFYASNSFLFMCKFYRSSK